MELIHANELFVEQQSITDFIQWDLVSSTSEELENNDFELMLREDVWNANRILRGHYIYEPGTEWGGRVESISHEDGVIKVAGPTWRGLLSRKVVKPPVGQSYFDISLMDANQAISQLIGNSFGDLVTVSDTFVEVDVSGSFRYENLLKALHLMLNKYGLRLNVIFENPNIVLSAELIQDLSEENEFSQDYGLPIKSKYDDIKAYNHVIALGQGQLIERQVIELYRDDQGNITSTQPFLGVLDKQIVLDYPNAESIEELDKSARELLVNNSPISEVSIDTTDVFGINLGDIVGGRDRITDLLIKSPISKMIRRVDAQGESVEYLIGGK